MIYKPFADIFITIFIWVVFLSGLVVILLVYPILYLVSLFTEYPQGVFQRYIHYFMRFFIEVLRFSVPGLDIKIHDVEKLRNIKSSIILCNHISFLDGLILLSVLKNQISIVKSIYFKVPILGWIISSAGCIPSDYQNTSDSRGVRYFDKLKSLLQQNGNLIIFPEGKRSRNGMIQTFKKGAFTLSLTLNIPLHSLYIRNTNRLFVHNKSFPFNTCVKNCIELYSIGFINPDLDLKGISYAIQLRDEAYNIYLEENNKIKSVL